jgi:peptidoglycan/LPS O-acetylase OafA/YrhL
MPQDTIAPRNNLDFIRTVLALGVLSFHTFQVVGIPYWQLPWVQAFIAISGYLVTDSMYRSAGYGQFAWKRLLRIGPGFVLSFGLLAVTGGSIPDALTDWLFLGLRYGGSNPPLWSLGLEEVLYLSLAICFALGIYRSRSRALWCLCAIYLTLAVASRFASDITLMPILSVVLSFVSGSFLYLARDRVPWSLPIAVVCLAAVLWLRNTSIAGEMRYALLIGPPLAYGLLTLGLHARPVFAGYKRWIGDPSFGIYVYHFPILMWLFTKEVKGWWLYLFTLILTVLLALISWHVVEKRALGLKTVRLCFDRHEIGLQNKSTSP